ncbi:MAG: UDP-N-acetylmuramoyl-tripeptide--D-alanyl-D-alanine ligase [Bacteroidales bacterium]|nr:UDP-N-acetylmuramoyl-tripeptide--D-alanyl-D-alanine ligase [Bacteroidales bacterium]
MDIQKLYDIFISSCGVSTDTRTIPANSLFVALKGENFDANTMIAEALERGAMHVVTTDKTYENTPKATVVDDTLKALQQLAAYHRQQLDIPIVGITGTNGKTTTKELVASVLRKKYNVYSTKGNLNNHIGVPLSLLSITDEHDIAVIEMGASHPGEIRDLAAIVRPDAGLITNVGIAHIQGFGSFEGVKKTKGELYDQLKSTNGTIFINATNEHLVGMLGSYDRTISYGTDMEQCLVDGHVVEMSETLNLEWRYNDSQYRTVRTHLTGAYNLENVLAATTVGCFYGVSEADICEAISEYTPTNSRSQIVTTSRNRLVLDAYNANPSSMNASLDNFASLPGDNKMLILGAMRELGTEQDTQHHAIMSKIQKLGFNSVYLVGEEFNKFASEFPQFTIVSQASELFDMATSTSDKYILIKGSRSNKLEVLVDKL